MTQKNPMPDHDLVALWENYCRYELETRDVGATMATMVDVPYVNHVPTMTGGATTSSSASTNTISSAKTRPTRSLPGSAARSGPTRSSTRCCSLSPTQARSTGCCRASHPLADKVEIALVAIVRFDNGKVAHEHIYWDQASVLVRVGLLDPKGLPVAGVETARKVVDKTRPSNTMMNRWAVSEGKPIRS